MSSPPPLLCFRLSQLLAFYLGTVEGLLGAGSQLAGALAACCAVCGLGLAGKVAMQPWPNRQQRNVARRRRLDFSSLLLCRTSLSCAGCQMDPSLTPMLQRRCEQAAPWRCALSRWDQGGLCLWALLAGSSRRVASRLHGHVWRWRPACAQCTNCAARSVAHCCLLASAHALPHVQAGDAAAAV